ncbi:MAG: helix-turn-helix domain-containing protein [Pyrinomonadaceae bacterium]|nr:helix-turn-helix domain-containing protein [Pyrinomonadaceae bacterium]
MPERKKSSYRQLPPPIIGEIYDDGFLRVEHENFYVECGGEHLRFGRGEFLIISLLSQKAERYVTAELIWNYLWNASRPLNLESLKVFIYNLRRKLKPFGIEIETMANVGYRLVPYSKEAKIKVK